MSVKASPERITEGRSVLSVGVGATPMGWLGPNGKTWEEGEPQLSVGTALSLSPCCREENCSDPLSPPTLKRAKRNSLALKNFLSGICNSDQT